MESRSIPAVDRVLLRSIDRLGLERGFLGGFTVGLLISNMIGIPLILWLVFR